MYAVFLDANGYVSRAQSTTLAQYAKNERFEPKSTTETANVWRFVDRDSFWDVGELTTFRLHPTLFYFDATIRQLRVDYFRQS